MRKVLIVLFSLSLLTACVQKDQVMHTLQDKSIVFPPEYKVRIDGKEASISGSSSCSLILPGHPNSGSVYEQMGSGIDPKLFNSCVLIKPEDTEVKVRVVSSGKTFTESWAVERNSENSKSFSLRRPNGSLVNAYKNR